MRTHHHYTEEEKQWLIEQDRDLTYAELVPMFNERFNCDISPTGLKDLMCKRLKIDRTKNSRRNQFKYGAKPQYEKGAEVQKHHGYVWVKVDEQYFESESDVPKSERYRANWRRKSDLVWEQHYGKLKDGEFIVFLDGDKTNCNIENLYAINRSIHATMCKMRWYSSDPQATRTAIEYVKLRSILRNGR